MANTTRRRPSSPPLPKGDHEASLFSVPSNAWRIAGWALLPLRVFIGATFMFAGLQKLSNPDFFNANSPSGIQAQLIASIRVSPLHSLLGHFLPYAVALGVVISLGELAAGIGLFFGLWTRIAAIGGAAVSAMLFLTVSFHASPYYTGADIVWFFACLPFIVTGAGGAPSFDLWIQRRAARDEGAGDPSPVVLPFARVQEICGHYSKGTCSATGGDPCGPINCPAITGSRTPVSIIKKTPDAVDRRTVVIGSAAAVGVGIAGGVLAAGTAVMGRAIGGTPKESGSTSALGGSTTTSPSTPTTAGSSGTTTTSGTHAGTLLGAASAVPVGGAATFQAPNGEPGIVLQPTKGQFLGYDAICPHAGCTVGFSKAADLMVCPCHGSEFQVATGDVITGPSPTGLKKYVITESGGQLYLQA